jgi:hypothetical protein
LLGSSSHAHLLHVHVLWHVAGHLHVLEGGVRAWWLPLSHHALLLCCECHLLTHVWWKVILVEVARHWRAAIGVTHCW